MSAYSDYKCGAISEDEYKMAMRRECADSYDRYEVEPVKMCCDCAYYQEATLFKRKCRVVMLEYMDNEVEKAVIYKDRKNDELTAICVCDESPKYMHEVENNDKCDKYDSVY